MVLSRLLTKPRHARKPGAGAIDHAAAGVFDIADFGLGLLQLVLVAGGNGDIRPGFGHAAAGGAGSRGVLEVRCHEAPFVLEHGQVVGRLVYERMAARPETLYGAGIASNYQGQGLKLAKQFKAG